MWRYSYCPVFQGATSLDNSGNRVQGFLFTSENLQNHWHMLDKFEGSEYERVPVEVTTLTGQTVQSCIYMLKHKL
ncbi:gamma-glutamylcyclotransferase [Enterobacter kobei]|nr:gamma-glutamylcyclotransferase [Enterobacter kobei]